MTTAPLARRVAPAARAWLATTRRARVLHVFARACNLVNGRGEVLALVTPEVGPGPFALVIGGDGLDFRQWVDAATPVTARPDRLALGAVTVFLSGATAWNPRPRWGALQRQPGLLRAGRETLRACLRHAPGDSLASLLVEDSREMPGSGLLTARLVERAASPAQTLAEAISVGDVSLCQTSAAGLAGLGAGLTPAGDDFLLGAIYAAWSSLPAQEAEAIAAAIADVAAPLTTPLSAAWLRAAARGEADARWHGLVTALLAPDSQALRRAAHTILQAGHTSGADALAGFVAVLTQTTGSGCYVLS